MAIIWDESFRMGVGEIDSDHRGLVDTVNAFEKAEEEQRGSPAGQRLLHALINQFTQHCRREETMLDRSDYPDRLVHASLHQDALVRMTQFAERYQAQPPTPEDTAEGTAFLSELLRVHITEDDPPFKTFLKTLI